jgi:hypothetical protein
MLLNRRSKNPAYIENMDYRQEPSQCNSCKHFKGFGICPAFPDGIPVEIVLNQVKHDDPLEGQEGELIHEPK